MGRHKNEMIQILEREVSKLRTQSYIELLHWAKSQKASYMKTSGRSGKEYQISSQAFFDDKKRQTIRVMVSIDDGGLSAFVPKNESFIMAPDGSFVDE